jgi:hypothetical protein
MNKTYKQKSTRNLVLRKEVLLLLSGIQLSKVRGGEEPLTGGDETCGPPVSGALTCTQ